MASSRKESRKRLKIAKDELASLRPYVDGCFLSGSVAYAPNTAVTSRSDVDLVFVTRNLSKVLPRLIADPREISAIKNSVFDGYCVKKQVGDVPLSIHVLGDNALRTVSNASIANLRLYRNNMKGGEYLLHGFGNNTYNYGIKDDVLAGLEGVRTIVPVSFNKRDGKNRDRYYMGIHRDKLLSNPKILLDSGGLLERNIGKAWETVANHLLCESNRLNGGVDLSKLNILNALAKKDKFGSDLKRDIRDKTIYYLNKVRG